MKPNQLNPDVVKRINEALLFIDEHIAAQLTLANVSAIAHYSPFHFHRLFKIITGETLTSYINRKRIEKSAAFIIRNKQVKVADLYTKLGFDSNSSFTRTFKKIYGLSPTQFKSNSPNKFTKVEQVNSKNGQKKVIFRHYLSTHNDKEWINANGIMAIKELPAIKVAYLINIGEAHLMQSFQKLIDWAETKNLHQHPDFKMLTIYHDSYKITNPTKIKTSAGIMVNDTIKPVGEIALRTIKGGKFVVSRFEIPLTAFAKAWRSLFVWLNENGYRKRDEDCFEIYQNDFRQHPEQKSIVAFYIPIF
jgi:AraC family transcriptional regulator